MDIHLTGDQATSEERAAVDRELGDPQSGWEGGERRIGLEGRAAFGGQGAPGASRSQRHMLLPILHAIQARIGWISPGAVNYAATRLDVPPAEVHSVASFYGMFSLTPRAPVVAHVCDDIACMTRGAGALCAAMEKRLGPADGATWLRGPCLGLCERAPASLVTAAGVNPRERVLAPATSDALLSLIRDAVAGRLPAQADELKPELSVPQAGQPQLRLLHRVGRVNPASIEDYRRLGGFEALRMAREMGPERVIGELIASKLLGRGGAAFPTGKKSEALQAQVHLGKTHYVVCNADESEPGTFKDRIVMEGDPFAVLEGMAIIALAAGARKGYIYIRGEYPYATECLTHAIEAVHAAIAQGSPTPRVCWPLLISTCLGRKL